MKLIRSLVVLLFYTGTLSAQIGGNHVYEFLNLTNSARILALGSGMVNVLDDDINIAQQIPSLNNAQMNYQLSANFTNYYAGIKFGSLVYGLPHKKLSNISVGGQYINYGEFNRTDEFGNKLGTFSSGEYAGYISSAIHIDSTLYIGASLKGVYSSFEEFSSYGVLTDFSGTYRIKEGRVMASLLMRNLGFQISTFAGKKEPMPFELLLGISTKLEHAPMRWSLTWSHLEQWDLSYESEELEIDPLTNEPILNQYSLRDNIFSHLHLGTEFLFSKNFNIRLGYNFRRRQELALDLYKHNVGLSWGFCMKISKFHFNYSRAALHAIGPMHTFSITSKVSDFIKK